MTTPLDEMIAEFERADDYMKERELRAKRIKMPADPEAWLLDLEKRLAQKLPQLPEPVRCEYSELMTDQIKTARNWLALGEQAELRTMVALLLDNFRHLQDNIKTKKLNDRAEASAKGGRSTKLSEWAVLLAEYLVKLNCNFPAAWAEIPEDENLPLELNEDLGVYRSDEGRKVVAVDLVTDSEIGRPQSRSNFEKRYFRPARNQSGQ
ncbi:hypothetical protein [Marinobacter nauticus]|uniref:hypothetical protein n=1 Tax=Marinobacter nauticus TaxID=2743 RepID=UPI001C94588A|nr:hypothetical protein [Marinobacter nauticus]MBY6102963.1 hypothetical protein [Marinobacter nauticus]